MRHALEYSTAFGLPISQHCEDPSLVRDGHMHEGWVATRMGLRGRPASAEETMVARDIALAELLGAVDRVLRAARKPNLHEVVPRPLDVDGAIRIVRAVLALRATARWRDVVSDDAEPWEVLSALLALLELARRSELKLAQPRPFSDVEIRRELAGEAA